MIPAWPDLEPERLDAARERVALASAEAVQLAMDVLHDRAICQALWERTEKELR
jgi:hypothetical protein